MSYSYGYDPCCQPPCPPQPIFITEPRRDDHHHHSGKRGATGATGPQGPQGFPGSSTNTGTGIGVVNTQSLSATPTMATFQQFNSSTGSGISSAPGTGVVTVASAGQYLILFTGTITGTPGSTVTVSALSSNGTTFYPSTFQHTIPSSGTDSFTAMFIAFAPAGGNLFLNLTSPNGGRLLTPVIFVRRGI
jgi:hypothetical protein